MIIQKNDSSTNFTAKEVNAYNLKKLGLKARQVIDSATPKLQNLGDNGTYIDLRAFDDKRIVSVKNKQKEITGLRIQNIPRLEINVLQAIEQSKIAKAANTFLEFFGIKEPKLPELIDKGSEVITRVKTEEQIVAAANKLIEKK